jgi:hypothetical protein
MLVFLPQRRLTKLFLTACRNINGLKRVVRSYLHRHTSAFVDFSLCLWTVRHSGCEHTPLLTQHYITHKDSVRTFFQKKNGYANMVLVLFTLSKFCILGCLVCIVVSCLVCIVVVVLCVLSSYVYLLYYVCTAVFTLHAGLLARSQYSEGPETGHLDTSFSWFPCVYKQMLRWFSRFQVVTTCFSCSPPDLNLLVANFIFCIYVK